MADATVCEDGIWILCLAWVFMEMVQVRSQHLGVAFSIAALSFLFQVVNLQQ